MSTLTMHDYSLSFACYQGAKARSANRSAEALPSVLEKAAAQYPASNWCDFEGGLVGEHAKGVVQGCCGGAHGGRG